MSCRRVRRFGSRCSNEDGGCVIIFVGSVGFVPRRAHATPVRD